MTAIRTPSTRITRDEIGSERSRDAHGSSTTNTDATAGGVSNIADSFERTAAAHDGDLVARIPWGPLTAFMLNTVSFLQNGSITGITPVRGMSNSSLQRTELVKRQTGGV